MRSPALEAPPEPPRGLEETEAARLLAARGPLPSPPSSRSYASIVRANVLTVFNAILAFFGALTLAFGDWRDALFLGILVSNSAIGITQEVRAKRALDRLAALVAPTATVVREGRARRAGVEDIVVGDLVRLDPGDQLVADGRLERADELAVDEAILTGESRPVARRAGEEVRSGSFAVEGSGLYTVTAVGAESYAERIADVARAFRHPRSPLERALNRLLLAMLAGMVPLGAVLGIALWERRTPLDEAVPTSVAAVVSLVPEGLILLASLTYAVAAVRMARRGALVQQLNAVESLASVDVICLDKTGTLTERGLHVVELVAAAGRSDEELSEPLGRYAAAVGGSDETIAAIAAALPANGGALETAVPFSARRRWSGGRLDGKDYVLGAPELFDLGALEDRAVLEARAGRRVLAFGAATRRLGERDPDKGPPPVELLGLAVLAERLRPDARDTVEYLREQGVRLVVLSGDHPETAASIARDAGIDAERVLDGRHLPEDGDELARLLERGAVVGRISPEGKRRAVEELARAGAYVAMVGDGVNDVPALKAARLAIAQGGGVQMAKSVADLVLVRGDFSAVPAMMAEGRRILRNLQRVAKLFVTKSAFAAFLILSIGITATAYPLLPRHLTLAAAITIGIPSFFLALAPSEGPYRSTSFLRAVSGFALPAGTAAGLGVLSSYLFALNVLDLPLREARTVATSALVGIGLYLIVALEAAGRRRSTAVGVLAAALAASYLAALLVPGTRDFFALAGPSPAILLIAAAGATVAIGGLWLSDERFGPGRSHSTAIG